MPIKRLTIAVPGMVTADLYSQPCYIARLFYQQWYEKHQRKWLASNKKMLTSSANSSAHTRSVV